MNFRQVHLNGKGLFYCRVLRKGGRLQSFRFDFSLPPSIFAKNIVEKVYYSCKETNNAHYDSLKEIHKYTPSSFNFHPFQALLDKSHNPADEPLQR